MGISLTNKIDIEKVLTVPLTPMPTSMCHTDGSICKTDKSQLVKFIEKKIGDNVDSEPPSSFDVAILDGFFNRVDIVFFQSNQIRAQSNSST